MTTPQDPTNPQLPPTPDLLPAAEPAAGASSTNGSVPPAPTQDSGAAVQPSAAPVLRRSDARRAASDVPAPAGAGAQVPGAPAPVAQVPGGEPAAAHEPIAQLSPTPVFGMTDAPAPGFPAAPQPGSPAFGDQAQVPPVQVPGAQSPVPASPVLDDGTFTALKEPRGAARLELDGSWHQISRKYVAVQLITNGFVLLLAIAAAIVVGLVFHQMWAFIPAAAVVVATGWAMAILPRQARAYGYMLRADDIVFRRGILWQRMVAVPYGRMQLVDVTHGPLDRAFGIAQLKLVTAAATTGATIPGLTQAGAEQLRDTLIEVAESRRTGL